MNDLTLVVMAAGLGSRFGEGIKQLAPMGPKDELLIDYAVHDAIAAGFRRFIFVLRREIRGDFDERIGTRLRLLCDRLGVEIDYAYQDLRDLPDGVKLPRNRVKPWGTGHAILCCRRLLRGPFAVINADDYYGKKAYHLAAEYLSNVNPAKPDLAMIGFVLQNTLSEHGGVTRGICRTDENGYVIRVEETRNIVKTADGAEVDGERLDVALPVSLNFWALTPAFLPMLSRGFSEFLLDMKDPEKDEYLLPVFIDRLLQSGMATVRLLESPDRWHGVTYRQDREEVAAAVKQMIREGVYSADLFSDLK